MKFDLNFQRVIIAIACSENPPIVVQGEGGIETPPPRVFVLWQYCETILFSVESLLSSLKITPTMVAILPTVLDFTKN